MERYLIHVQEQIKVDIQKIYWEVIHHHKFSSPEKCWVFYEQKVWW